MDNLLAGKLILPFEGRLPAIVLSSAAICLWKSFRRSRTQLRDRPETVRLHPGTGVHLHPGILFGIIPEHRSESSRNRVHLAPESPPGLAPGEYQVKVSAKGFSEQTRKVSLEVGQQMRLDLTLSVSEKREVVDVVGRAEVLKTSDASLGEVVETKSVQELPLNGRMLLDLALTVPGAHHSHGAQAGDMNPLYWRPGQPSAISISGGRPNANYFLVDGVTNTDPTFNTQNISLSPDAVQEFRVQTGSYAAELGGAGGGQINIATRSGTSLLHGTAYEYLRNGIMDTVTFGEMSGNNRLIRNNFGGSAGGPLAGKKTFFFANYESLRLVRAMTMTDTVPSMEETSGDFTGSGTTIFDPSTAHPNPNYDKSKPVGPKNPSIIRVPFPDNKIPANRLSPVATTFLNGYVPQPNMMGGVGMNMIGNMGLGIGGAMGTPSVFGAGTDANNYLDVRDERHQQDQGTLRVDRVFDNGDSVFARYSVSSETGFMPQNLPGFGAFHDNMAENSNITWNRIIRPNLLNTASVAFSRLAMHRFSENNPANDIVTQLGIKGVGYGGAGAYGSPYFNVQGYSGMGDSFLATPMHAWDSIIEGRDVLSWQHGRHNLKYGASYRWYIWPMWGFFQNRGYYQFTSGFTTQTATNDGTGSALASFLLGLPAVRQRQAGIPSMDLRQWYADAFAGRLLADYTEYHRRVRAALRIHEPAQRREPPMVEPPGREQRAGSVHWRPEWHASRSAVSEQAAVRAPPGAGTQLRQFGLGLADGLWHLLHPRGYEYVVQPTPQRAARISGDEPERQLHSVAQWIQLQSTSAGQDSGQLHGLRPACSRPVCSPVERIPTEEPRACCRSGNRLYG
ncbi:MAG: carboxypeptidase-like regulatory domain-containing protein [Bryobacteraceae bacterium]